MAVWAACIRTSPAHGSAPQSGNMNTHSALEAATTAAAVQLYERLAARIRKLRLGPE